MFLLFIHGWQDFDPHNIFIMLILELYFFIVESWPPAFVLRSLRAVNLILRKIEVYNPATIVKYVGMIHKLPFCQQHRHRFFVAHVLRIASEKLNIVIASV